MAEEIDIDNRNQNVMATDTFTFLDHFTKGVYGEHARINNDFNGGPVCASQVPIYFILGTIVLMVSFAHFYNRIISLLDSSIHCEHQSWLVKTVVGFPKERRRSPIDQSTRPLID
jgi:hypothetical protein